jgi:predicted phage terminase large subunit-like protein
MTFVPEATPSYDQPLHLKPLLDRVELALQGVPQRICCHAPPRHSKTESMLHIPAFALRQDPTLRFAYCAYGDRLSRSKSRRARAIAQDMGIKLDSTALNEWRTVEGGGLLASGVGGPLTGHGVDFLIIDDPVKNRIEAESSTYRDRLHDWWRDVARTRLEPGGSAFVFMTRWHRDDLIGRLVDEGFEYIKLPAISDEGEALWPERWPIESLKALQKDVGPYTWASLFQGEPRPRGGAVFDGVKTWSKLPTEFRGGIGLDLSYSGKTHSDHSVAVRMIRAGNNFYVTDMIRRQATASAFKVAALAFGKKHPNDSWRWYASGTELGTADFFKQHPGVPLRAMPAKGDKFTRAVRYAAAWADGRVLLPERAPWVEAFVNEHLNFTGINDKHDDIIDASVAAFDELDSVSGEKISSRPLTPKVRGLAAMDI